MTEPSGRRFDDDEVSLILRRVGELQQARSASAGGMSLAELESVAREAGLDPALVRQAAAEVQSRDAATPALAGSRFLGAPTTLRFERVVDGEVPASEYDVLVDEIRRAFNDVGSTSTLGRTLAWSSSTVMHGRHASGRGVSVTIVARNGRTVIRAEESLGNLAGGLFGGIMGGGGGGGSGIAVGVGMAAFHSALAAVTIWGALLGGTWLLARTIYANLVRRRASQLSSLVERLAELATPPYDAGSR
jgi:hypothetical protein